MSFYSDNRKLRRVVITGLGVISANGVDLNAWWRNLLAGRSAISEISMFDTSKYAFHRAGEVKEFTARNFVNPLKLKTMGRASQLAIAGTRLAFEDAGLSFDKARCDMGVILGTTMGEVQVFEQIIKYAVKKREDIKELRALISPASSITMNIANEFKLSTNNLIFSNACAAGNFATGYAYDLIKYGHIDSAVTGGVDALSRIAFTGFGRLFAMASQKCQPFDKNRQGMMLGEGAAILILESLDSALKRNASIYAEIGGYGVSCDALHMTHPDSSSIAKAITKCLINSAEDTMSIDYISAHGTGTKENDVAECEAYRKVFGEQLKKIPISSIKSMLGHSMGAASAFESIACCMAYKTYQLPPTINLENLDPECAIDCIPNKSRPFNGNVVLNNAQAFGGNNASILIKRYERK